MSETLLFTLIFVGSVLLSSFSQLLLKKSADRKYPTRLAEYLNPYVIVAYILFLGSTLITVYAYRFVPLSLGPILESLGYVFVGILGYCVLKERIGKRKFIGMLLIVAGVIVSAL